MSIVNCKCKDENRLARNFALAKSQPPHPSPKAKREGMRAQSHPTSWPPVEVKGKHKAIGHSH
jgi:hypothetical protein